jgi:MurNAc alpha-1-phosphate uridylyltransferase
LLHRRAFSGISDRIFSLVRLFDLAEKARRLRAVVHDGEWYHIGTPQGLAATRERLSSFSSDSCVS